MFYTPFVEGKFTIEGTVLKYPGPGGWYFVEAEREVSEKLKKLSIFEVKKVGWGYIKVTATIGRTTWETTLFPQKGDKPYLIAIKESVRKAEDIAEGDSVRIVCTLILR